jgi:hypothetical protein
MPDRTDERIRALIVELAEQAPAAPTFQELEHRAITTEARPRRRRAVMVGAIAIASLALVVGVVLAPSDERSSRVRAGEPTTTAPTTTAPTTTAPTATAAPTANFPGFLPAPGWQTVTTPSAASATAANIPLGPYSLEGSVPWDTVERLQDGDIVLFALVYPMGNTAVDANFPTRELPLSLDDSVTDINYNFEGQPDHIYADRLGAQVSGWNIDLLIFYGGGDPTAVPPVRSEPSTEARAAAQEQLERLVVPARE